MLFLVLYDTPVSVFLNSLVIVLVSGPKKVKVAHFSHLRSHNIF
jgi:hypothetical protein